jgi:hypothetical protein
MDGGADLPGSGLDGIQTYGVHLATQPSSSSKRGNNRLCNVGVDLGVARQAASFDTVCRCISLRLGKAGISVPGARSGAESRPP